MRARAGQSREVTYIRYANQRVDRRCVTTKAARGCACIEGSSLFCIGCLTFDGLQTPNNAEFGTIRLRWRCALFKGYTVRRAKRGIHAVARAALLLGQPCLRCRSSLRVWPWRRARLGLSGSCAGKSGGAGNRNTNDSSESSVSNKIDGMRAVTVIRAAAMVVDTAEAARACRLGGAGNSADAVGV